MASDLNERYEYAKNTPSDINEHVETLRFYAQNAESVLELGIGNCVSSWAFVKGLSENGMTKKNLISCDIINRENIADVERICKDVNVQYEIFIQNDLLLDIKDSVDVTFIDTWHVYGQLKRELEKFSHITSKYIIMHDTEIDAIHGESIRMNLDIDAQTVETGFTREEITKGLMPAINEFLHANSETWKIEKQYTNNNGLMILKRIC